MKKCFLTFLLIYSFQAFALIGFEDAIFPELASSSRAEAMGNAFMCKVDDASAAFYNPAGLGTVRYPHLHLSNFLLETNKDLLNAATGGTLTNAFSNVTKGFTLDGMRQLLKNSPGEIAHSKLQALPNFTMRYFSLGFLIAKRTRATVTNTLSTTGFEVADRLDLGPYAAFNFSLFGGVFKMGVSGVILTRKELNTAVDPNATLSVGSNSYNKGTAAIVTTGARLTLPVEFLPTLSVKMHNTLKKSFSAGGAGAPTTIPSSIDVGASITPQIGTSTRIHLEANYKDLGGEYSGISMTRRLLIGLEVDFARTFFFRLGYGDGFGSGGIGIRTPKVEFDLTTYAVDTTTSAFRGKEDRRFSVGISTGF